MITRRDLIAAPLCIMLSSIKWFTVFETHCTNNYSMERCIE